MAGPPGVGPKKAGFTARLRASGPFNPSAKLDTSQVVDLRAPPPMDVAMQNGHPVEWYNSANAGGISWNPAVWTVNPGPMNTGHRTEEPRRYPKREKATRANPSDRANH
jgi:hypothetical protein